MTQPADRDELVELLSRYAWIVDAKDWDDTPATVFAERVRWDFEGVGGGPEREIERTALVDGLRAFFARWQATHHAITNHQIHVDGDVATIRAHVHAEHWRLPDVAPDDGTRWLVVGFYDDVAVRTPGGWRLRSVRLTLGYEERSSGPLP